MTVSVGFDLLPGPIVEFAGNLNGERPSLPHVYHVSSLVYCLRKEFFNRTSRMVSQRDVQGKWNVFRGSLFDRALSPLFKVNQRTFLSTQAGITISGTIDFIYEGVLYDLKMPASVVYKKREGAGQAYVRQVKSYLALMHAVGEFLEVTRARVLMVADDVVVEEVEEDPDMLRWLWDRAFMLDQSVDKMSVLELRGPEEKWECNPKYCQHYPVCQAEALREGRQS